MVVMQPKKMKAPKSEACRKGEVEMPTAKLFNY